MTILEQLQRTEYGKRYKELALDKYLYGSFVEADFEWACDRCLETKKAILASPGLQETPWTPNLAYSDTLMHCNECKTEFTFKKEEKGVVRNL